MLLTSLVTLAVAGVGIALVFTTYSWLSSEEKLEEMQTETPTPAVASTPAPEPTVALTEPTETATPTSTVTITDLWATPSATPTLVPTIVPFPTVCTSVIFPFPSPLPTIACIPRVQ